MSKRIPTVSDGLTQDVGHRSTEPRVGSSNLSGRAKSSGNSRKVEYSQALAVGLSRTGLEQLRILRGAVEDELARRGRAA